MEEIGGYCWCFLGVISALEMKIINDGVNQLRLRSLDGSVIEFLHLYAQEVPNVALVIDGESLGACMQVSDHCINGPIIEAKDNTVIDVDQEDDWPTVIETWVI